MTRRCAALVVAMLALGSARAGAQVVDVSVMDLLAYYEMGQHARVTKAVAEAARGNLVIVLDALKRDGAAWIAEDGPKWTERRRMVLATFALEVAHAGLDYQWKNSSDLLEWTCTLLRRERSASAFERAWHLAALALFEGARDLEALEIHLAHMKSRVPDEPRLRLARAFVAETEWWEEVMYLWLFHMQSAMAGPALMPAPRKSGIVDTSGLEPAAALIPLLEVPGTRNEAALRLGFFSWRAGRSDEALGYLRTITTPDDAGQAHLVHLFSAWSYERQQQPDRAIDALRASLDAVPGAQSASLMLAVRLHSAGRRQEAQAVMDRMLALDPPAFDPWRNYGYGDLRRWPVLLDDLRRRLR